MIDFGKLNFSVSFNPTSAFPLDARYYFDSKTAADTAAAGAVEVGSADGTYYIGENIVVVENNTATMYLIGPDKKLAPVGRVYIGDDKTIVIGENNTIAVKGFEKAIENQQLRKNADGELEWFTPDTTDIDSLSQKVGNDGTDGNDKSGLYKEVDDLSQKVGNDGTDGKDKSGLYKELDDVVTSLAGVFHFKGTASKYENGDLYKKVSEGETATEVKITDMRQGDVYQVLGTTEANKENENDQDKEYVYTGEKWELLGFTINLSNYATTGYVGTKMEEAIKNAVGDARNYTDSQITALNIEDYAKTEAVTTLISDAKTAAINTADEHADNKIKKAIGEYDKTYTDVKDYIDKQDVATKKSITDNLGSLASKDEVSETELAETLKDKINNKAESSIIGELKIGEASYATVVDYVNQKVTDNTYNDTEIKKNIAGNTDAINKINDETTGILATAKGYTDAELVKKADAGHTHATSEITGLDDKLGDIDTAIEGIKTDTTAKLAEKADKSHTHATSEITGLDDKLGDIDTAIEGIKTDTTAKLAEKADKSHTHATSEITGLDTKLGEIDTKLEDRYTKAETNTAIQTAVAGAGHLKRVIVDSLPDQSDADLNTIYMIKKISTEDNLYSEDRNVYTEYMLIETQVDDSGLTALSWEIIGDSAVDLTDYLKKTGNGDELQVTDASTTDTLKNILAKKANEADLATVAKTGAYGDLTGAPTKVSAFENDAEYLTATTQVQSDWNATSGAAQILNKPTLVQKQVITITKSEEEVFTKTYKNTNAYVLDVQLIDKNTKERVLATVTYGTIDTTSGTNNSFTVEVSNAENDLIAIVSFLGEGNFDISNN